MDNLAKKSTFNNKVQSLNTTNSMVNNNTIMNSTMNTTMNSSLDKSISNTCNFNKQLIDSSKSINANKQNICEKKQINERVIITSLTTTVKVKTTTLIYYKPLKL